MKRWLWAVLMLGVGLCHGAVTEFTLKEGTSDMIYLDGVVKAMVKDTKVASVEPVGEPGQIKITAGSFGQTQLLYWRANDNDGPGAVVSLTVTPRFWDELLAILANYPQIAVDIVGEKIMLRGLVASQHDMEIVGRAVALDPQGRIINMVFMDTEMVLKVLNELFARVGYQDVKANIYGKTVHLDALVENELRRKNLEVMTKSELMRYGYDLNVDLVRLDPAKVTMALEQMLAYNGYQDVKVNMLGKNVHLIGTLYDEQRRKNLEEITKSMLDAYGLGLNMGQVVLAESNMDVHVQFVQIDESKAKDVGITISDIVGSVGASGSYVSGAGVTGGAAPAAGGGAAGGVASAAGASGRNFTWGANVDVGVSAKIHTLLNAGAAKIAYQATIKTRSGQPARFQQGGTIYKEIATGDHVGVSAIEYGLIMNATPKIVGKERIETEIKVEASVPLTRTGDIDISKYATDSNFTINPGGSIALSGLNQMLEYSGQSGVPLLNKIPVLGAMFKNYDDSKKCSEAILIVTVDWHKPADREPKELFEEKLKLNQKVVLP
ncbi:MAG: hypothetical protein ACOX9E_05745 [Lentisphaeria bacterium]